MEPKYLAEEVIIHPNHHLTFGDWIPRKKKQTAGFLKNKKTPHVVFDSRFVLALWSTEFAVFFMDQREKCGSTLGRGAPNYVQCTLRIRIYIYIFFFSDIQTDLHILI